MELLAELDPCKIPEAVRGRFAQLTLSSNKKKEHGKIAKQLSTEAISTHEGVSACKNLRDLLTDDESETEAEELNKIFKSKDSATTSDERKKSKDPNSTPFILERLQVSMSESSNPFDSIDITDRREISSNHALKSFENINNASESLFTRQDNSSHSVNQLSKQISSLQLKSPERNAEGMVQEASHNIAKIELGQNQQKKLPQDINLISMTSNENSNFRESIYSKGAIALAETVSGTLSEVISLNSLRSSIPRKISLEIAPAKKEIDSFDVSVVTISSASSSPSKNSSICVSETDEEEIIVLSDTDSEGSSKVNVSSSRPSGQTNLGSTLSNTVADRIEAFLKDIPKINADQKQYFSEEGGLDNSFMSTKNDESIPEDSVEITETSSEGIPQEADDEENLVEEDKKGDSHNSPTSGDKKVDSPKTPSSPQISVNTSHCIEKINISATIKIKVQISEPLVPRTCSSDSDDNGHASQTESIGKMSGGKQNIDTESERETVPTMCDTPKDLELNVEKESSVSNKSNNKNAVSSKRTTPNKIIDTSRNGQETSIELNEKAKKLLDQLYGSSWQTPEIIKTLDKMTEESRLNFTEFHENINIDLESTRLNLPKRESPKLLSKKANVESPSGRMESNEKEKGILNKENIRPTFKTKPGRGAVQKVKKVVDVPASDEPSTVSDDLWVDTSSSESNDSFIERSKNKKNPNAKSDKLVYLDLSSEQVKVQSKFESPAVNNDKNFNDRLQEILKTCKYEDKPKIELAPPRTKTKRKLFTARFGEENEDQISTPVVPVDNSSLLHDTDFVTLRAPLPAIFAPINKQLEAVKTGVPIFSVKKPSSSTKKKKNQVDDRFIKKLFSSEESPQIRSEGRPIASNAPETDTPHNKYGFLKSLDVSVAKALCHPDALFYRENFKARKAELVQRLYGIFNEKLFNNDLDVSIVWNKKLLNTAGRCSNKKMSSGERSSKIELSEKVLTSADRLRCTLIHELCHAATWIYNGENGHGTTWKAWARKANEVFPELPKIGVCHQYDIEYKYTYKCTLCGAKSHAHSKSKKVENIRCSFCHGAIEIFLNKKDKEGNVIPTPVKEPSGFAKFVKEKYKVYKKPELKHTDVMKILSNEFASLSITEKNKY